MKIITYCAWDHLNVFVVKAPLSFFQNAIKEDYRTDSFGSFCTYNHSSLKPVVDKLVWCKFCGEWTVRCQKWTLHFIPSPTLTSQHFTASPIHNLLMAQYGTRLTCKETFFILLNFFILCYHIFPIETVELLKTWLDNLSGCPGHSAAGGLD